MCVFGGWTQPCHGFENMNQDCASFKHISIVLCSSTSSGHYSCTIFRGFGISWGVLHTDYPQDIKNAMVGAFIHICTESVTDVLQLLKSAQMMQHGVRHGDYTRSRKRLNLLQNVLLIDRVSRQKGCFQISFKHNDNSIKGR